MTAPARAISLPALLALAVAGGAVTLGLAPVFLLGLGGEGLAIDDYFAGILKFTLLQAFLSTFFSLLLGLPVALALARRRFPGREFLIRLLALPLSLPAIVGVLGILTIFGRSGFLGGAVEPYGLTGILVAHVFFNFPLAARMALASLEAQPAENQRLGAQLGFSDVDQFRHCDGPALFAILPGTALLVFLLCLASFTIVLTLGGGPSATTLEVAIYQALRFDFDPARATTLALVQIGICSLLALLAWRFPAALPLAPPIGTKTQRFDGASMGARLIDGVVLAIGMLVLLPPLVATVAAGLSVTAWSAAVVPALLSSLMIGFAAATLSLSLCWPLAGLAARSRWGRHLAGATALAGLVLPPAVMATGWFIVASRLPPVQGSDLFLVIALNSL
ncbi:MAG: thiamine/thiamine pyrophosphate ABC transporter permease ThiP, partial [Alphaproteobacteria bacterium]|nr:thiamine/thiamine pyrophosphate ABC transporter permease ThiP [Alphaproteobacteria bacterium]